jgi:hypothetical protein
LGQTQVAVAPLSTVILSCLARKIPVVALGWYDWLWSEPLRGVAAISTAGSIGEAVSLVERDLRDGSRHANIVDLLASQTS